MAFVPKVHNREVPVANHPVAARHQQELHGRHLRSLHEMRPSVDTRWGGTHNGVREQKKPVYPHVRANLKRAQIQDERFAEIELENTVLLNKLSKILRRSRNDVATRDWSGGIRLTPNQVPVIDHYINPEPTNFGAAKEATSLNLTQRRRERERIEVENRALVARLQSAKATYDSTKFAKDAAERERWLASHAAPRPLSPGGRAVSADMLASSLSEGSMTGGALTASGQIKPPPSSGGKLKPLPPRRQGKSAGGKRGGSGGGSGGGGGIPRSVASGVDEAVLSVLDLLSTHMRGASSSLGEMRLARDSLMEGIYPVLDHYHVNVLDCYGVKCELVCSRHVLKEFTASDDPRLIVLVHGGMFVTGSPRAGRHLAAKLSDLSGMPVVTPTLRLAPEHPFPAALDDLKAAYEFLSSQPVGGAKIACKSVAIFAESSGGALTLGMLNRGASSAAASSSSAAHPPMEPAAIVLASPWLDMTCSSSSYGANEQRDPVMQRKRLLGIARAYLGESSLSPSDPLVSPILGSPATMLGLPPTLLQVGSAEVLLDESLELERLAKDVGAEVHVQQFDGVLHAWHTFFPLMPRAVKALEQAAAFLCQQMGVPTPGKGAMPPSAAEAAMLADAEALDAAAREAAATRMQAIQRGRQARKGGGAAGRFGPVKKSEIGPTTVKWTMDYEERQRQEAAVKLQAASRGHGARKKQSAALTYASADVEERRALKKKEQDEEGAATRMQAIQRGKKGRQKAQARAEAQEGGWNSGSVRAGFVNNDNRSASLKLAQPNMLEGASDEQDAAAGKLQAMQRARAAKKERAALVAEREQAATKLQSARRGQQARLDVRSQLDEKHAKEDFAASKVQGLVRGKSARGEVMKAKEERKDAATKVQAARRGQAARREVSAKRVGGEA